MLVAIAVPLVAVAVGTLLALAGGASPRVLVPVRSFALAAVLVAVVTHLLPEAIAAGGPWALAVFAAGILAPQLIGRIGGRAGRHARLVTELGFVGVLLHQVGDGLVLGAVSGHWDVVVAIGAHTVPLAAAVALGMVAIHGRRAAIIRAAVLVAATVAGVVVAGGGGPMIATEVAPWVNAAVAGLLVHLLSHDLPTPARSGTAPLIEVLAIAAGVALPLYYASGDALETRWIIEGLLEATRALAVPLVIGLAAAVALEHVGARVRARVLARGTPVAGIAAAAMASSCSCRVVPTAHAAAAHARPAAIVAFLLAAPELGLDTLLVGSQLLGVPGTVFRVVAAIVVALIAGEIANRVAVGPAPEPSAPATEPRRSLLATLDEVIIHSGPWLAMGIVASVLVAIAVPPGALVGSAPLAIGVALVLALPAYVCAAAATPLAMVLINRGLPPGAAIAGLLLGAATNRAGVALIARRYGTGAALAAVSIAAIGAIAAGIAIEAGVVGRVGPGAPTAFGFPEAGAVTTVAVVVLGLAALRGLWRYGLAAWLEPLHATDHHHHQHADGAPCEEGCHDH